MGWTTEDGQHEGYLVPLFLDGQRGHGVTGGSIPHDHVVVGDEVQAEDGGWSYPTRPAAEVTGWAICCDCSISTSSKPTTWTGPVFTRVPSPSLESIRELRIFAEDDDVPYVADRPEVENAARELWRSEHAFAVDAIAELEAASEGAAQARLRLDAAVALARHSGASWADIGRAVGMARQSAQERWHDADARPSE